MAEGSFQLLTIIPPLLDIVSDKSNTVINSLKLFQSPFTTISVGINSLKLFQSPFTTIL